MATTRITLTRGKKTIGVLDLVWLERSGLAIKRLKLGRMTDPKIGDWLYRTIFENREGLGIIGGTRPASLERYAEAVVGEVDLVAEHGGELDA